MAEYRTAKRLLIVAFVVALVVQFWVGVLWSMIGFGALVLVLTWMAGRRRGPRSRP